MFYRVINEKTKLSLTIPQYCEEIFVVIDQNRDFLKAWLPWLDHSKIVEDVKAFNLLQLDKFKEGSALNLTIFYEDKVAGIIGYNTIDQVNGIGCIGYWLAEKYNGKGIMTACVKDLIKIGRDFYNLQKVDIRCATGNTRSRAIPERLGFHHAGTLKRAEKVYNRWLDHEVYELIL